MKRKLPRLLALAMALLMEGAALSHSPGAAAAAAPRCCVYFPNWNIYGDGGQQVKNLPWDSLDCVYHAFWKIVPSEGGYAAVSTDPWADTDPANPRAHFPQYAQMKRQYPGVSVLLSVGGWTCSGLFSEMCLTAEGRQSFIGSCIRTLESWPFLDGVDLDWEYPGEARTAGGEGNPVLGDDRANYTLLLREMRAALDGRFGKGAKQLTVCAASAVNTLRKQDYAALFPYVNRINLMTYDMTGAYAARTGHHSALFGAVSADTAVKYLMAQGVPAAKICIGSPLYGCLWRLNGAPGDPVGAPADGVSASPLWKELSEKETAPGWQAGWDEAAQAAWLRNTDPSSPDYGLFCSYESRRSLDAKAAYIRVHGLGGLILWQSGGDGAGWPMLRRAYAALHGKH